MHSRFIRTLLFAVVMLCIAAPAFSAVGIVVGFGPPPLPVYEQPICPGDGYLWTPGYWGWGADFSDYYWVPGTWVMGPEVGFLWTPGYWGWGDGGFMFYDGYWGPTIGFYGGINYGFGYFGTGFEGGRWDNGHFFYNRAVMNVNVENIHNVYNTTVNNTTVNRVSFNGGDGGITARATPEQEAAAKERHIPAVAAQTQHMQEAHSNPQQRASVNQGKPAIAATAKPGDFKGDGVVKASEAGGRYTPPANRGENQARGNTGQSNPGHVRDLPPAEKPAAPNTGDAKLDKKYQQQQDKQYAQQQKERQKLQQQQEKEDQKVTKQNNDAQKQKVEQQHQQQTQQLQQRHQQQNEAMQQRMQAPAARSAGRPPR
jgi:hypothetical protein